LISAATLALFLYLSSSWWLPWAGNFLVAREGPPRKADAALVLAGDSFGHRIMRAAELAREGLVPLVFVSGPSELYGFSEDQLAIRYAVSKGAQAEWFVGVPNHANSTEDEALSILPDLKRRGVKRLLLVTSNFHTRRATRIFRKYAERLGVSIDIHPVAAKDALYDPDRWWQSRPAQKTFLLEWTKTLTEPFGI
jgi:uncharacterized SAM-binding protein YcdF (DUF218 family)